MSKPSFANEPVSGTDAPIVIVTTSAALATGIACTPNITKLLTEIIGAIDFKYLFIFQTHFLGSYLISEESNKVKEASYRYM